MSFRYQQRVSLGPLHVNLSRSGVGMSVGTRGARWGVSSAGQNYRSLGIPGTGISWRSYDQVGHESHGLHTHWLLWLAVAVALYWGWPLLVGAFGLALVVGLVRGSGRRS